MKGFKDSEGKFHPIKNKNGTRMKRDQSAKSKGVSLPKLEFRLPERKESFSELTSNIQRNAGLRNELLTKNESLAEKILANPTSEFNESWRMQIRENTRIVRNVNNDIKHDVNKLTPIEKKQLPDDIKNLMRFL